MRTTSRVTNMLDAGRRLRQTRAATLYLPSLAAGAVGKLGSFAALLVLAWTMIPQEFGLLAAATLVSQSLSGLFSAATLPTVARRAAKLHSRGQEERLMAAARAPIIMAATCSATGLLVAAPFVAVVSKSEWDWRFALMGALTGAPVLLDGLLNIHAGHGRTMTIARAESARGSMTFVLTLLAGLAWGAGAAATATLTAEAVVAGFVLIGLARRATPMLVAGIERVTPPSEARLVGLAFMGNLAVQVGMWSLQLNLSRHHGLVVLAAYGIANRFAMAALLLPTFLTRNLLGHISQSVERLDWNQYRNETKRYLLVSSALAAAASAVAIFLSRTLFEDLFSKYPFSTPFLLILLTASVPAAVSGALGVVLISVGRWKRWILSDVAFAAILLSWTMFCYFTDRGPLVLIIGLPLAYAILMAGRAVSVRSSLTRGRF